MGKNTQRKREGRRGAGTGVLREFSAGGIVYRQNLRPLSKGSSLNNSPLFLIIQPKDTDRWQFPKGHLDKNESSQSAAIREVREEGGVTAKIIEKIGSQQYFFNWEGKRIFKTVTFFLMEYQEGDPKNHDKEVEEAVFLSFDEAIEKLTFDKDKKTLKEAKIIIERGTQTSLV